MQNYSQEGERSEHEAEKKEEEEGERGRQRRFERGQILLGKGRQRL